MKIIVHGGLLEPESLEITKQKHDALKDIVTRGYDFLTGHTAAETAAYTVSLLEDNPLFNAGTGSEIQSDGRIRMSSALCDGETQRLSGVINIEYVKNPVKVAEKLMGYDDKVIAGDCAIQFAHAQGFGFHLPFTHHRLEEFEKNSVNKRRGTVGCVVLDAQGSIAAATSTGGVGAEMAGRVPDSPTVAGTYANAYGGVSCCGTGEDIANNALAAKIVTRLTDGFTISDAFDKSFRELEENDGDAGAIGISRDGSYHHSYAKDIILYACYDGAKLDVFSLPQKKAQQE